MINLNYNNKTTLADNRYLPFETPKNLNVNNVQKVLEGAIELTAASISLIYKSTLEIIALPFLGLEFLGEWASYATIDYDNPIEITKQKKECEGLSLEAACKKYGNRVFTKKLLTQEQVMEKYFEEEPKITDTKDLLQYRKTIKLLTLGTTYTLPYSDNLSTTSNSLEKIRLNNEVQNFKKNWQKASLEMDLNYEVEFPGKELKILIDTHGGFANITHNKLFRDASFKGSILDAYFYMPGIALIATHLAEKHDLKGLFVSGSSQATLKKVQEILDNPEDQRCALIVENHAIGSSFTVGHVVTICLEKKDGKLSIAHLDSIDKKPYHEVWILSKILEVCKKTGCTPEIFRSDLQRQSSENGCFVFALQDAVSFLEDPQFIKNIGSKKTELYNEYNTNLISALPPGCMIPTQSLTKLEKYKETEGTEIFNQAIPGRKKTLNEYLKRNVILPSYYGYLSHNDIFGRQNLYVTKKHGKYMNFLTASLKELTTEEIKELVNVTLLT